MMGNTSKSFVRDIGLSFLPSIAGKLKALILIPVVTKWVGSEAFGIWKQFAVTSGFLAIISTVGTAQVIHRYLAPMDSAEKLSRHLSAILVLVFFAALSFASVLAFAPSTFSGAIYGMDVVGPLYLLASYLPILAVSNRLLTFLKARRRFDLAALVSVARDVGSVTLVAIVIVGTGDVVDGILSYVLWEAGALIVLYVFARKKAHLRVVWPDFSPLRKYIAFGAPLALVTVGARLAKFADRYIIVNHLGTEEVGIYSVAYAGGAIGVLFLKPLTQVLLPDFSVLVEEERRETLKRRLSSVLKYFLASQVGMIVLLFFLGKSAIVLVSTQSFLRGLPVLKIIPVGIAAYGILQIGVQVLNAEESTRFVGGVWVVVGIINVVANVLIVPLFGLVGAALATVLSYAIGGWVCWWRVHRLYPIRPTKQSIAAVIISALSASVVLFLLLNSVAFSPLQALLLGGFSGGVVYLLGLILSGFVSEAEQKIFEQNIGSSYARFLRPNGLFSSS